MRRMAKRSQQELANGQHEKAEPAAISVINQPQNSVTALSAYNPRILNRARTQLQLGEWEKLTELDEHELQHNPASSELQLLAAAGHLQKGGESAQQQARALLKSAIDAGSDREAVARILIGSASNTLGRLAALTDRSDQKILGHFQAALAIANPDIEAELLLQPMAARQLMRLARATGSDSLAELAQRTALSFPLSDTAYPDEDTKADLNLEAVKSQSETQRTPLTITAQVSVDGEQFETRLAPNHTECFKLEDYALHYELPGNSPGYLVSNDLGDFERPPTFHRLALKPHTAYEISAEIPSSGEQRPVLWFFEYSNGKKSKASSYPIQNDRYSGHLRTGASPDAINFGIRVGGKGSLPEKGIRFSLRSGTDVEIAETLQSQLKQMGSNLQAVLNKNEETRSQQSLKQLEAFIRLQNYLGDDFMLPEMHGWAVSPDFGVLLIKLLERQRYDAVVEFGSGVSTVIVARILQKQQQRADNRKAPLLSFDHLEQYADQTRENLQTASVAAFAEVVLSPLTGLTVPEKGEFQYYDCLASLQNLAQQLDVSAPRVLVLVDGPPAATGKLARYPALHCLLEAMGAEARLDFLLDDYIREDERNIIAAWEADLKRLQLGFSKEEFLNMEKQACLFKVGTKSQ